jgi:RNA polymerase sigma-70 factor (ECF subfamily)
LDYILASRVELSDFLASIERRAFKQAMFAVHNEENALDIVQDAMMRLTEKYGSRPVEELPLLFQRILQNAIRDFYRRNRVRTLWTTLLSAFGPADDEDADPLESLGATSDASVFQDPQALTERSQVLAIIEKEVTKLPPRQREAFLMRYWEEMDTTETAAVMGCSEGSVKTHCSRATHTIAAALRGKGIVL